MAQHVSYRTVKVDGLSIFYREAGPKDAPTILLLHGLPSSSRMFEPLLTRLADQFHMVAPDYPGFGHSDAPTSKEFSYTFDNIATVMDHFTEALNLTGYTLYMQDYGGPVGFRMTLAHPDRVEALIVQNAVAHNGGLGTNLKTRRVLWGKYDVSFELTEPEAYRRDVPKAQVHVLDAGHFALDTAAEEIADLVRRFVSNTPGP